MTSFRFRILAATCLTGALVLAAATTPAAAADKVLRVGFISLPDGLGNPHQISTPFALSTGVAFFDPLVFVDAKGELQPGLAASWENKDETTWHFRLRPNVRFHNGAGFDAAAMVADLAWLLSTEGATSRIMGAVPGIASARAVDAMTVEIKTKTPNPIFNRSLAWFLVPEPKRFAELGPANFATQPVGSGPFRVTSWKQERIEGTAFKDSWRAPRVDAIAFVELPEKATRVQALSSGQLDIAMQLGIDDEAEVKRAGGKLEAMPEGAVSALRFNTAREGTPTRDVRVRQAMNYAVDKGKIIEGILAGRTEAAGQPTDRGAFGYNPDAKPYPFDPAKAKALLAQAGHPNGVKVMAEVLAQIAETRDLYAQAAADLAKVGVQLELRPITLPDLTNRALGRTPYEGDMSTVVYATGTPRDAMRHINIFGNACGEMKYYCDPEIMPTIEAANREFDQGKRRALVQKIMGRYNEQASSIFFYDTLLTSGIGPKVRDFTYISAMGYWERMDLAN